MNKITKVRISRIQYADLYIETNKELTIKELRQNRRFVEEAANRLNCEDWQEDEDSPDVMVEHLDSSGDYIENLEDWRIVKYE